MDLTRIDEHHLSLTITEKQILVIMECLREPFAYLHRNAFDSRLGISAEKLSDMGKELMALLEREKVDY